MEDVFGPSLGWLVWC